MISLVIAASVAVAPPCLAAKPHHHKTVKHWIECLVHPAPLAPPAPAAAEEPLEPIELTVLRYYYLIETEPVPYTRVIDSPGWLPEPYWFQPGGGAVYAAQSPPTHVRTPELDSSGAGGALTLLAGMRAVARGRK